MKKIKKTTVDINFLPEKDYNKAVNYIHKKYPTSHFKVGYFYSPFSMGYNVGYCLSHKIRETVDILGGINPTTIYDEFKILFPKYEFDELYNHRVEVVNGHHYPQYDKLFNFLTSINYEIPKDRVSRFLENPFSQTRIYIKYDLNGKPIREKNRPKEVPIPPNEFNYSLKDFDGKSLFDSFKKIEP